MRISTASATRLGIYFFYDPEGVVDEYVLHFLREMNRSLTRLIVVCNGELTDEGRTALESVGASPVIQRDNEGFDVWAYKTAIDFVGWDELAVFDEIILMNFTVMGPVDSFQPMFAEMDTRDLDFWGMTVHHGADFDPWGMMPDGVVPLHIQSHFIAVRRPMVTSAAFQSYWDTMFPVRSYEDSVGRHESLFTQRFEREGFAWGVYVDTTDIEDRGFYPLFNAPVEMIESRQSPIFKRKGFFMPPDAYLDETANRPARQLLDYLRTSDGYDVDLVVEHLVRSANNYDLVTALNLYEVLGSREDYAGEPSTLSVAVLVAVRSAAELATKRRHLEAAPAQSDFFIVSAEPVDTSGWSLARQPTVAIVDELDSTALAYWQEQSSGYDLLCVIEATEPDGLFPFTNQEAATEHNLDSVLASRSYAQRVLAHFDENPRLGSLVPIHPLHHVYFGHYADEWHGRFDVVAGALGAAGIRVPLSAARPPVTSGSGVMWIRSAAVAPFRDSPEAFAPLDDDARRLAMPFVAQSAGFYSSFVAPDVVAANLLTTAIYAMRGTSQRAGLVPLDPAKVDGPQILTITRLFERLEQIRDHEVEKLDNRSELLDVSEGFANALAILANKEREIAEHEATIATLRRKLAKERVSARDSAQELNDLKASRSWRIGRTIVKPLSIFKH